jgi:NAD-dependent SIR2 family protein deacetylase
VTPLDEAVQRAAQAIAAAEALVVTAGAGMGVDSGLPDFRGDEGFWNAYPAYAHLGLSFVDLANPRWFEEDPHLAWGFYGHRLNLYRTTEPHDGFARLRAWAASKPAGAFVFTSNVDGQFQRAGFDESAIVECHGTIEAWQCARNCGSGLFAAAVEPIAVDPKSCRAADPLPRCPGCGALARPNVLMFGDDAWNDARTGAQRRRFEEWLGTLAGRRVAIVECGAGTGVPTVRRMSEVLTRTFEGTLVRINLRESSGPSGAISIRAGARDALAALDAAGLAAAGG